MKENRPWVIWLTCIAVICLGLGIYLYYSFFRQSKSELIEAIPTDAAFVFALNDNDGFVTSSVKVAPYLNELFVIDALPAYETMRSKLPVGEYDLTVSGHSSNDGVSVLFNMHADKAAFKRLLRALSIDPNNYTAFENNRIYTYGTNFKSMKFVFLNHVISFSTDMELLKRAIVQHSHPKNLLSDKQFKEMYNLSEKNRKQNWLIINPKSYASYLSSFLKEDMTKMVSEGLASVGWTALQLRFSGNEMFLSGYAWMENNDPHTYDRFKLAKVSDMEDFLSAFPNQVSWYVRAGNGKSYWSNLLDRTRSLREDETAVMNDLNPAQVGCFALRADTNNYPFYVLLPDSTNDFLGTLYADSNRGDSVRIAHPNGIYPLPHTFAPLMRLLMPDSMSCVVAKDRALVFAPSETAATAYLKSFKSNEDLSKNHLYGFVNEAVASSSVFNYVIFHEEADPYWTSQLSEKGKASHFGKEMRIFSLSCDAMEKGRHLLPVNLYLLF